MRTFTCLHELNQPFFYTDAAILSVSWNPKLKASYPTRQTRALKRVKNHLLVQVRQERR
ncbi:hypothetical protein F2Q69_00008124 [Brassica cretica]|uniref:Uncharacterized protein n=1 Tax=Brassica cretica TaxID=69181 RepID=A0A8S9NR96_BRACR|nr:hypothetical protein F2Q69_00008124 [Brassica cretica]